MLMPCTILYTTPYGVPYRIPKKNILYYALYRPYRIPFAIPLRLPHRIPPVSDTLWVPHRKPQRHPYRLPLECTIECLIELFAHLGWNAIALKRPRLNSIGPGWSSPNHKKVHRLAPPLKDLQFSCGGALKHTKMVDPWGGVPYIYIYIDSIYILHSIHRICRVY